MPPQETNPTQPGYDFIFNQAPKSPRSKLPQLSGPVLVIAVVIGLMLVIIVLGSLLGGKKASTTGLSDVLGQAQEITRVNALEQPQLKDPVAVGLEATSQSALTSDQIQLKKYMSGKKVKADAKKIAGYQNSATDSQLASAASNNNLDSAYENYLRTALAGYADSLKTAYAGTSDPAARQILKTAYDGVQTILASSALKNS